MTEHSISKPTQAAIYALADPRTGKVFYVGKADNPRRRLTQHVRDAKKGRRGRKSRIIRSILEDELRVSMEVLEHVPHHAWQKAEQRWIAFYGLDDLGNTLKGGNGSSRGGGKKKRKKRKEEIPVQEKAPIQENGGRMGLLQRLIQRMK